MKFKYFLKKARYVTEPIYIWRDSWDLHVAIRMTMDGIHFVTIPESAGNAILPCRYWNEDDSLFLTPDDLLAEDWQS